MRPSDLRHRLLHGMAWALALGSGWLTAPAAAQNVLANPGFDGGSAGWTLDQATWTGAEGHTAPGAARCASSSNDVSCFAQCAPVVAGKRYDIGGFIRLTSAQTETAAAIQADWSTSPDCSSTIAGTGQLTAATSATWTRKSFSRVAPPGAQRVWLRTAIFPEVTSFEAFYDDLFVEPSCATGANQLCLGSRFEVEATWRTGQGDTGSAHAVPLTGDSGYFWFFNAQNAELFVKVIDACVAPFDRFWFFAAGLTNVRVELKVTDTESGQVKNYVNPQGQPFKAIQDTNAFDTCP